MKNSFAGPGSFINPGITFNGTDAPGATTAEGAAQPFNALIYFFDLRERETYLQLTYPDFFGTGLSAIAHIQIFSVNDNCNENDFFDNYTVGDTHVYDMRDLQSNDGNPSGVLLSDEAYGIVVITLRSINNPSFPGGAIGNMRIVDNNGYEYRTNAQNTFNTFHSQDFIYTFNFNNESGIVLSDVVGINLIPLIFSGNPNINTEWDAQDVANIYSAFDVDIYNTNEVPFSCRNVIFSCVDEDNPRLQELLENAEMASVASFEYGINEVLPHSKGKEVLCPGNVISSGIVNLTPLGFSFSSFTANSQKSPFSPLPLFYGFLGLNNGNKRGSFDSLFVNNLYPR